MILEHYPMVRAIAFRLLRSMPPGVDVDDLISVGTMGLIEAVDRFDPRRAVSFSAFARLRIRGAMVDALRSEDWLPIGIRRKRNRVRQTREELSRRLGREPTHDEAARALGVEGHEYRALLEEVRHRPVYSLEGAGEDRNLCGLVARLGVDACADTALEKAEMGKMVTDSVGHLPARERSAVSLYYLHDLTLKEVGDVMGVSECRASQLRLRGVERLRFRLARRMNA